MTTEHHRPPPLEVAPTAAAASAFDFDLHGALRVRLVGADRGDVRAVARLLGEPRPATGDESDLTIRYHASLDAPSLTLLGHDAWAYSDEHFYVLGRRDGRPKAIIPFADLAGRFEVSCRRGLGDVPYLIDLVRSALLARGILLLHASAFEYEGRGVLVSGWTAGGKSEALLAFARHGARYVGDEVVAVEPASGRMWGIPYPLVMRHWQLPQLAPGQVTLSRAERVRIGVVNTLLAAYERGWPDPGRLLFRAVPRLRHLLRIPRSPAALFGSRMVSGPVPLDVVILAESHRAPDYPVWPRPPEALVLPIHHTTTAEQGEFLEAYRAHLFAFPGRRSALLDGAAERQTTLLREALSGRVALHARHPYPFEFETLYTALRSHIVAEVD